MIYEMRFVECVFIYIRASRLTFEIDASMEARELWPWR